MSEVICVELMSGVFHERLLAGVVVVNKRRRPVCVLQQHSDFMRGSMLPMGGKRPMVAGLDVVVYAMTRNFTSVIAPPWPEQTVPAIMQGFAPAQRADAQLCTPPYCQQAFHMFTSA